MRKKVELFGDVLSLIQGELETRELSTILTDSFAVYAHIYREAQREWPVLTFRNDDEVRVAKGQRLLTDWRGYFWTVENGNTGRYLKVSKVEQNGNKMVTKW